MLFWLVFVAVSLQDGTRGFAGPPQSPSPIAVSGTVQVSGTPVKGIVLQFRTRDGSHTAETRTDDRGHYEIGLPIAGAYFISCLRARHAVQARMASFVEGPPQTLDWNIEGGVLYVDLQQWPRSGPTSLLIETPSAMLSVRVEPTDSLPAVLAPADFGMYRVTAAASDGATSRAPGEVTLDRSQPIATVAMAPSLNTAVVSVYDPTGGLATGASAAAFGVSVATVRPGVFSMRGVPAGSAVVFQARDVTPSCRLVPGQGTLDVVLARGRVVTVEFERADGDLTGELRPPASECPVPITAFPSTRLPAVPGRSARFLVSDFPLVPKLQWKIGTRSQTVEIPVDGKVILKQP